MNARSFSELIGLINGLSPTARAGSSSAPGNRKTVAYSLFPETRRTLPFCVKPFLLSSQSSAEIIANESTPTVIGVAIDCTSDFVLLEGNLHILIETGGDAQFRAHFQPQDLSGVSTNGVLYQGTGITAGSSTFSSQTATSTFINRFRIVGAGPGNDFVLSITFHITLIDGEIAVAVNHVVESCGIGG